MKEQTTYIDKNTKILDLDAYEQGNYIAFTEDKLVLTDGYHLKIDTEINFPIIRQIDHERFIIADARTKDGSNGHIYNFQGQRIKTFNAGDGIQDILVHREKIVITYFDEGIVHGEKPNGDGLAIFDFEGNQIFGFNSKVSELFILDCYCICKHGANRILFYTYTDLKVCELNLDTYQWEIFDTPDDFSGASAITSTKDKIILYSSYNDKRSFFSWDRNNNQVIKFGNYPGPLKGIGNGKFLTFGDLGFTIIDTKK